MINPQPKTIEYCEFLRKTASGEVEGELITSKTKIAAYIFAVTAPFMRLYQHLGDAIRSDLYNDNINDHTYQNWLKYYAAVEVKVSLILYLGDRKVHIYVC